ncbi:MAG: alkaline phosphatase family protein [Acidobacteria bacterium]|nr:alkaline phosphatase family protein [Acidobacteriota bacterium]
MSPRRTAAALGSIWLAVVAACAGAEPVRPASGPSTPAGTGGTNDPSVYDRPHVVLVSFDGFHPAYLDRFETPNFASLAERGMAAEGLVPVFPSLTFPSHYSIATGLYPGAHGIAGNRFWDPVRNDEFNYRDPEDPRDGSWWLGEPIWVTAEEQGMVAAAFFFPGTEAAIGGIRPSHYFPYDGSVPNRMRVAQTLDWLALPPERRPHVITLYFSLVDSNGHRLGPDHPGMRDSVETADGLLGDLMAGVDALPHADRVALVVLSDHGMATPDPDLTETLPESVDLTDVRAVPAGPSISLHTGDDARSRALRDALNAELTHARAWLREELPEHLHARDNASLGEVMVIPDGAGMVQLPGGRAPPAGMHGWDPRLPSMHGIFFAVGPGIAEGVVLPPVEAVDVYPLIAHLLGLTPADGVAGSLEPFRPALRAAP